MTNKERWLSATALLVSIVPFILLAGSMQLLPDRFPLPTLHVAEDAPPPVYISKYKYLYLGLMGFVPALLVCLARFLKSKKIVERNFKFMVYAALCLGLVFLVVTVYGVLYNIHTYKIDLLRTFEFFSATVVVVSLAAGMLANFFPSLKRNEVLGLKNRYTMSDNRVWLKVHHVAADVYMCTFFLFALFSSSLDIFMDFRLGWVHIVLWVCTVAGLILWGRLYSRAVCRKLSKGKPKTDG